jgi:cytochrome c oxidase cbb3-type subunit 2
MNKLLQIAGGAVLIYIVIVMGIAVIPAIDLSKTPPGPGVKPLTALQAEGAAVYAANGCAYCHTQQVRPLAEDKVFGRPSAPGDFSYQTPELLGSERTGPDLSNIGSSKPSDVWQYIHLFDPRAVVPESVMPNFKFLFHVVATVPPGETTVPVPAAFAPKQGKVIPTQQAKALVAYLLSLKQTPIPGYAMNGGMGGMTSAAPAAAPAPAPTAAASGGYSYDAAKGQSLFMANCSACHQTTGEGIPGAFPPLKGNAAVDEDDATVHIHTVLQGAHGVTIGGVAYSSVMPPFADQLSDTDIANIVNYERSSWGNHAKPATAADVAAVRAKGP